MVRQAQEFIEQPEFVHDPQRRRVNRVAAKVAQKIRVFFKHDYVDAGAGQEKPRHQPSGTAADDATLGRKGSRHAVLRFFPRQARANSI